MLYPQKNLVLYTGRGTSPFLVRLVLAQRFHERIQEQVCNVQNIASLLAGWLHISLKIYDIFN
jgi:hypothetical protein